MTPLNVRDLGEYIREQRSNAQISVRQLAKLAGVSNPYLSQIERGMRKPSAEILQQIAKALRISAEALYVQAGILDERGNESEVPGALLADQHLNERQKQVLLEIYESFRRENAAGVVATAAAAEAADLTVGASLVGDPDIAQSVVAEPVAESSTASVTEAVAEAVAESVAQSVAPPEAEPVREPAAAPRPGRRPRKTPGARPGSARH